MNEPCETIRAVLESIVGADSLRQASPTDAVDSVLPQMVVEPGNTDELARVLAYANKANLRVAPRGGGTKLDWGNVPQAVNLIVSTRRLNRIVEHAWGDMTVTVEAGCTVSNLQQVLAEHNQRLALDPLWPTRATVGGILATNDSGPLRAQFGSLRDLIIGVTVALPNGTLAKSGGKVVKNVAGYDLPKLFTGSLGTLGVITEATFRLHPLSGTTGSLSFTVPTYEAANRFVLAVQDSTLVAAGLQICVQPPAVLRVDVRFEGATVESLEARANWLRELSAGLGAREMEATPEEVWRAQEQLWQNNKATLVCKLSALPTELARLCELIQSVAVKFQLEWQIVAQGFGMCLLRIENPSEKLLLETLNSLSDEVKKLDGTVVVLRCPLTIKKQIDVWGDTDNDALPLMRRIKQEFDPREILNPGRFIGGI